MDGDARRKDKPIAKLLDAARLDLDAATRLLIDPPNVLAANHLQQAAEKILGRPNGEPRPLPAGDPWRERFRPLESLSAYATTFRYSLTPTPKIDDLRRILTTLFALHESARAELLAVTG